MASKERDEKLRVPETTRAQVAAVTPSVPHAEVTPSVAHAHMAPVTPPPLPSQVTPDPEPETRSLPTTKLLSEAAKDVVNLVRTEIDLAKAELKQNVKSEVSAATGIGLSAVFALFFVNMLLVAAAFGLAEVMPGWAAALVVAGAVLVLGGIAFAVGWSKHVRVPLARSREELKEDVRWLKQRTV